MTKTEYATPWHLRGELLRRTGRYRGKLLAADREDVVHDVLVRAAEERLSEADVLDRADALIQTAADQVTGYKRYRQRRAATRAYCVAASQIADADGNGPDAGRADSPPLAHSFPSDSLVAAVADDLLAGYTQVEVRQRHGDHRVRHALRRIVRILATDSGDALRRLHRRMAAMTRHQRERHRVTRLYLLAELEVCE